MPLGLTLALAQYSRNPLGASRLGGRPPARHGCVTAAVATRAADSRPATRHDWCRGAGRERQSWAAEDVLVGALVAARVGLAGRLHARAAGGAVIKCVNFTDAPASAWTAHASPPTDIRCAAV